MSFLYVFGQHTQFIHNNNNNNNVAPLKSKCFKKKTIENNIKDKKQTNTFERNAKEKDEGNIVITSTRVQCTVALISRSPRQY